METTNNELVIKSFLECKDRTVKLLIKTFGISESDCEDIFQDSLVIFYEKIRSGALNGIKSSLYTYFVGICKNKSLEHLRRNSKTVPMDDGCILPPFLSEKIDTILALDDNPELEDQKITAVSQIVKDLPDPCDKVLWGYFRDNLSVKALAAMYDKTESNIKVTKLRCCERFRKRFNSVLQTLLNN
ncbi:MAG: sigma-70 family RNA polymerase sigma factor [Bacteroidales bacterium]|nr:sigma-70 family RNA polymerase sigma factor [Bacteroidales bacterium]